MVFCLTKDANFIASLGEWEACVGYSRWVIQPPQLQFTVTDMEHYSVLVEISNQCGSSLLLHLGPQLLLEPFDLLVTFLQLLHHPQELLVFAAELLVFAADLFHVPL